MEREANLLRCAKLSCYAEFNRMVHAIARSGGEAGLSGARMEVGTSTEYLFYTTLVSMLNQVVRNTNRASQEVELQQVYQWFCANKPLIPQKHNPKTQRPKLSLSKRPADTPHRPQTAPATLLQPSSSPLPPQPHSRPHTAQPQHGFTSSYMSRSLSLTPHKTSHLSPSGSRAATPSHTQRTAGNPRPGRRLGPGGHKPHRVSLVEVPSQKSLSADNLPLNMTTLLQLAPAVAATMEWRREVRQEQAAVMSNSLPSVDTPVVPLEHTAEDTSRTELKTAAVTTAGTEVTELTLQPEDNSQTQPSSVSQPQDNQTQHNSLSPPQDHLSPTITVVAHTPSQAHPSPTHTITYSTRRTPIHMVTLDLSVGPQPSHTTRHVPSGLKRSGSKVASGFNCSRYRPSSGKTDYYSGSSRAM